MRIYGIYHTKRNQFVYIGRTVNENDYTPHGRHIKKLFQKYPDIYRYVIIEENILTEQLLNEREIYYISKYNTFDTPTCYNFTKGGSGGYTLSKFAIEDRHKIIQKSLQTKLKNPEIMKNAAKKAYETFLKRPKEERDKIIQQRYNKSIISKKQKQTQLTEQQKQQIKLDHSNTVKQIHQNRSIERKHEINNKIRKTLLKQPITLKNRHTEEILSLHSTIWQREYNVRTWFLVNKKQLHCHGWELLSR